MSAATMRIAIIGAGSAGMAMAKKIVDYGGSAVQFVVFERRSEVGGIWQHDAQVPPGYLAWEDGNARLHPAAAASNSSNGATSGDSKSPQGRASDDGTKRRRLRYAWATRYPPGPMFEGLRTNIPSDLMAYRDAPFPQDTHFFPNRATVQSYLEGYATKCDLRRHVRFETAVKHVKKDEESGRWVIKSQPVAAEHANANGDTIRTEEFTHLVLAHGRCNTPNIPNIPGLETFTGRVIHSQWYRDPSYVHMPEEPRRVLVVGNSSSGMDIAREFSGFLSRPLPCGATPEEWQKRCRTKPYEVLQSWHDPDKPPMMDYNPLDNDSPDWCRSIRVVARIERIEGSKIILVDGTVLDDMPVIIFGTGYLFDNAFLDQSSGALRTHPLLPPSDSPIRQGFPSPSVYNLDDWFLMHSRDETLAMLGLAVNIVPFPFTEMQSTYLIHRWLGRAAKLPRVDTRIPQYEPSRWTSRREESQFDEEHDVENKGKGTDVVLRTLPHFFGSPSGNAYIDALLSMIQDDDEAGQPAPWTDEYKQNSDGQGNGEPRGPEKLYAVSPWRHERRAVGSALRKQALGY